MGQNPADYHDQIESQQREELYVDGLLMGRITAEGRAVQMWAILEEKIKHGVCAQEEAKRWVDLNSIVEAYNAALKGF